MHGAGAILPNLRSPLRSNLKDLAHRASSPRVIFGRQGAEGDRPGFFLEVNFLAFFCHQSSAVMTPNDASDVKAVVMQGGRARERYDRQLL